MLKPAQHFERGAVVRRGFRVGDEIEAGNTSIRPTTAVGHADYRDALREELADYERHQQRGVGPRDTWWVEGGIRALKAVLDAEEQRLLTGKWQVRPRLG